MKSAVLITHDRLNLDQVAHDFNCYGVVYKTEENRLVVELPNGWFFLRVDVSLLNVYDEDELHLVRQTFSVFFMSYLGFSTIEAANIALTHINIPRDSLVDNDHGSISSIDDIRGLILRSIDWSMIGSAS